jgi:UDP-N-acetylglucosamine acyltransferase
VTPPVVVHPTALVDPRAELGAGVTIGAYAVIGPAVRLGSHVEVGHHAVLEGAVVAGAGVRIGHGCVIGGLPQDLKFRPDTVSGVRIGDGTVIREQVTIHRATQPDGWTVIGRSCLLMATCHVAHDCRLGDGVIVINYAGITGHCEIDDGATIGGLAGMHPFSRIGAYAYIGGCSKVASDVPPYTIVDGVPATARGINVIGLRRAGVASEDRQVLRAAYRILYGSGLGPTRAVARIREELPATPYVARLVAFVEGSKRGICAAASRRGVAEHGGEERVF